MLLKQLGLRTGEFIQVDNGAQLTSVDVFKKKCDETNKGTLFIDEAYNLTTSLAGKDVLNELLTIAENKRDEISIILAGYKKDMEDMINGGNVGLSSRFPEKRHLIFEDFTQPIIYKLLMRKLQDTKLKINENDENGPTALSHRIARGIGKVGFANAR